jgi:hypothetical protein
MQEHFRGQRQPTPHVCADIFRSGFQKPCASETPTAATTLALYATCRAAVDVCRRGRLHLQTVSQATRTCLSRLTSRLQ